MSKDALKETIKEHYGAYAKNAQNSCASQCCSATASCCCQPNVNNLYVKTIGYTTEELTDLPDAAVIAAAGCGNPTAIANLKPGETVLDLGSGGGIDVFMAARMVGPTGKAIGVDMTDEMITLAARNAEELNLENVEFRKGDIEELPVDDASVDVIISNCVINLAPNKDRVFKEAFRVLKPGGRLTVSDIVTEGELPEEIRRDPDMWASCVAGAITGEEYIEKLRAAGFIEVQELARRGFGSVYSAEIEAVKPMKSG